MGQNGYCMVMGQLFFTLQILDSPKFKTSTDMLKFFISIDNILKVFLKE